ncbi:hypothetical protein ABPG72_020464 [Tetrahymena utriculariae]
MLREAQQKSYQKLQKYNRNLMTAETQTELGDRSCHSLRQKVIFIVAFLLFAIWLASTTSLMQRVNYCHTQNTIMCIFGLNVDTAEEQSCIQTTKSRAAQDGGKSDKGVFERVDQEMCALSEENQMQLRHPQPKKSKFKRLIN